MTDLPVKVFPIIMMPYRFLTASWNYRIFYVNNSLFKKLLFKQILLIYYSISKFLKEGILILGNKSLIISLKITKSD